MAKEKAKHDGLLCFLLALIVVLILVIGGGAYYFLVVDNGEEIENNNLITNTTVQNKNPYAKYEKLNWKVKDCKDKEKLKEIKGEQTTLSIENKKLYLTINGEKQVITTVKETPKYIIPQGIQFFEGVCILTEEGTAYRAYTYQSDKELADNFEKINIEGNIVDITRGEFASNNYSPIFYLTETGKLIIETGKAYEEVYENYTSILAGNMDYFVTNDNALVVGDETDISVDGIYKTESVKNNKGEKVYVKFIGISKQENKNAIIINNKNELLYISSNNYSVASKYEELERNSVVKNYTIIENKGNNTINIEFENGNIINLDIDKYYDQNKNYTTPNEFDDNIQQELYY